MEIDVLRADAGALTQPFWAWEIPVYLFLGGLAAGVMIVAPLLPREGRSRWARLAPFGAPLALSLGMGALFLDLEMKAHVFRFYTAFRPSSPMSWGAWILVAVYPVTLLLGLAWWDPGVDRLPAALRPVRAFAHRHEAGLRAASVALGVALGTYTGVLLSTLGARAAWASPVLGPLFLVSGLSAGAAALLLLPLSRGEHATLRRLDTLAIAAELTLLFLWIVGLATAGGAAGADAAALLLGDRLTAPFFGLVVAGGLLVPAALALFEHRRGLPPTRLAPALVLFGSLSLRWIVVAAGQA